jgi:Phage integrase, N-terminal SAM-like domain
MGSSGPGRVWDERGIYRQRNGKFAVCWRHAGRLRFRTVGFDVAEARRERLALIAATPEGKAPVSPRLRFETVAGSGSSASRRRSPPGERHPRTLEAHRHQLDRHLLPALGRRRVAALTVDDVAELLHQLRRTGCSAKTSASALATLQSVLRFARRCGWIVADPVERLEHDERPRPQRRRQRVLGRAEIEAPARRLPAARPPDAGDRPLHRPAHLRAQRSWWWALVLLVLGPPAVAETAVFASRQRDLCLRAKLRG